MLTGPGGAAAEAGEGSEPSSGAKPDPESGHGGGGAAATPPPPLTISIVISQPEAEAADPKAEKKWGLPRCESEREQCRVCQEQTEEPLMDLGCRCRGELAKAHRSCIEIWFRSRGSNKCEICQQAAANVPSPESHPSTNYWIWRVDPAYGGAIIGRRERQRGCFSPLWVAFAILIGGLLLDILISFSLGVAALPVNIIIGVLIVLGLGTAVRLALECCYERGSGTSMQRPQTTVNPMIVNPGYPHAV